MSEAAQRTIVGETRAPHGGTLHFLRRPKLLAAWFVLAVFLVYQPAWHAEFIWDDDAHLTAHRCIVGPLGFKEIWTTPEANYFPLVLTTFWVLNKIFGLNPFVFHLAGIALHATCGLLLWALLQRLRVRGALLGAALWTFHPVQVESVAWISEIINTQSCAFFLLSIWVTVRWLAPPPDRGPRRLDYALACVGGAAAILSKPSTVMLPLVLGLCCWWLRGRLQWRDAAWLAPFFIMALAASAWTIWEQRVRQGAAGDEWNQSVPERIVNAGRVIWFYLGKLSWPHNLSFIYPRWTLDASKVGAYAPSVIAAGVAVVLWIHRKKLRAVFVAGFYYGAMLFPVLGFFNVYFFRYSFVADHFVYLAAIGPLALAGAGIAVLAERMNRPRVLLGVRLGSAMSVVGLAALSWGHARDFRDDETLWRATLRTNPNTYLAHNNLGVGLVAAGKPEEALAHYRASLALNPHLAETHFNMGKALLRLPGRTTDAIACFENALRLKLKAHVPEAHLSLAGALAAVPARRAEAITHYQTALQLNPDLAEAHINLAYLLGAASAASTRRWRTAKLR